MSPSGVVAVARGRVATYKCRVCEGTTHHYFGCPVVKGPVDDYEAARAAYLAKSEARCAAYEKTTPAYQLAELEKRAVAAEGERDRARDAAAALEAECAELRVALERIRACKVPTLEEADEAARAFVTPDAFAQFAVIDARIIAAAVLARTDPLRADAEGGEDRD